MYKIGGSHIFNSEIAKENLITCNLLLGTVITNINYQTNRTIASLGDKIIHLEINDEVQENSLPLDVCIKIHLYNSLGRSGYQRTRRALKCSGHILPSFKRLSGFGMSSTPTIHSL